MLFRSGIYLKPADGTGAEELILQQPSSINAVSWSPDGKYLLYNLNGPKTASDVWAVPVTGDRKPIPILENRGAEILPQVSPDGKWIAYASNESGRFEIHVRPFPSGSGHWQLTTTGSGNYSVRWRGDSKEIYYISADSSSKLMAIPVTASGTTFQADAPKALFESRYIGIGHTPGYHDFAVSPDGQRFLIPVPSASLNISSVTPPIDVIVNWTTLLRH